MQTIGIRGAGLAGLSVALEIVRADPSAAVSVFDIRARVPHPKRTFCFFQRDLSEGYEWPTVQWNTVMFRSASFERSIDVSKSPYTMIRGDDFFSHTLRELEERGVTFRWGCKEIAAEDSVLTVDGEKLPFDRVIDAAFLASQAQALLWQSFAGVWITAERPLFEPSTATLMDLQGSTGQAPVSFLYVLPTSRHTALLEHTTFSPTPMLKEYHLDRCFEWARARCGESFQTGEYECGAIPMGLLPTPTGRAVSVGSNSGTIRPATGYAFLATRNQAREVARGLLARKDRETLKRRAYPRWLEGADKVFLHALLRAPERGEQVMERMLSRSRAEALISFLSGSASASESLSVWLSVPKLTMIRSLLRV